MKIRYDLQIITKVTSLYMGQLLNILPLFNQIL